MSTVYILELMNSIYHSSVAHGKAPFPLSLVVVACQDRPDMHFKKNLEPLKRLKIADLIWWLKLDEKTEKNIQGI